MSTPTREWIEPTIGRAESYGVTFADLLDRLAVWRRPGRLARIEAAVTAIPTQLTQMETRMAAREDASYDKLTADLTAVKDGWASLVAERDQYKAGLEAADANQAAAVAAALAEDSEHDADKIDTADAIIAGLVAPAPSTEPTPEPAPEPSPTDGAAENPDGTDAA